MLTTAAIIERLTRLKLCRLDLKCRYQLKTASEVTKVNDKEDVCATFLFFPAALDVSRDFRPTDEMLHVLYCFFKY